MKTLLQIILLSLTLLTMNGCIAAGIGLAAAALSDDGDAKKAFHENNTVREKAGLKPLTWEQWEEANEQKKEEAAEKVTEKPKSANVNPSK